MQSARGGSVSDFLVPSQKAEEPLTDNGKMDYYCAQPLGCCGWSIARGNLPNEMRKGEIGKILLPALTHVVNDHLLCKVMTKVLRF